MKAEEEDKISEESMLKSEDHNHARLKLKKEILLTLEARHKSEEEVEFTTES